MNDAHLILVANPGSASRKYALYDQSLRELGKLHFEFVDGVITCTVFKNGTPHQASVNLANLAEAATEVEPLFRQFGVIEDNQSIGVIGLRVVAPSSFFMHHHVMTNEVVDKLEALRKMAPLHIAGTLDELRFLREHFADTPVVGISDSAFHAEKPSFAWNYGININDADTHDIKRFGYHGLSVNASVRALKDMDRLPPRVVVCHLGSGSSVTAILNGRSIDNTMGYSPLEGLVMSTRSGTVDFNVAVALKAALDMNDAQLQVYLNSQCGLLGLGNSNDIRELRAKEEHGDHMTHLALETMVHSIHKAIGGMIVALGGIDLLVFTGTVGERSFMLRRRIVKHLAFLDFDLDGPVNDKTEAPSIPTLISQVAHSRPIFVIPTNENLEIARLAQVTLRKGE